MIIVSAEGAKVVHPRQHVVIAVKVEPTHEHAIHVAVPNQTVGLTNRHHTTDGCTGWRPCSPPNFVVHSDGTADNVWHLLDESELACSLMANLLNTVLVGKQTSRSPFIPVTLADKIDFRILNAVNSKRFGQTVNLGLKRCVRQIVLGESATNLTVAKHVG
jgi:hypothetical protein